MDDRAGYSSIDMYNPNLWQTNNILNWVGGFNPSEKYKSVGVTIPNIRKNVPNHKPVKHAYPVVFPAFSFLKSVSWLVNK